MKYTLEYADGYYIEKDGEGFLDFAEDVTHDIAQGVVDSLNMKVTPVIVNYLAEVACLEREYARDVLNKIVLKLKGES